MDNTRQWKPANHHSTRRAKVRQLWLAVQIKQRIAIKE